MKIKNTRELRLRAASHARNDHIIQGTYGVGALNGHAEFRGCAVGCLSTPHREDELREYLGQYLNTSYGADHEINGVTFYSLLDEDSGQRRKLKIEFGMSDLLIVAAEGFFEAQPTHGAAINFVRDFATALPEGAEITDAMIKHWLKQKIDYLEHSCFEDEFFDYADISEPLRYEDGEVTQRTVEFLDFLRSIVPAEQEQLV